MELLWLGMLLLHPHHWAFRRTRRFRTSSSSEGKVGWSQRWSARKWRWKWMIPFQDAHQHMVLGNGKLIGRGAVNARMKYLQWERFHWMFSTSPKLVKEKMGLKSYFVYVSWSHCFPGIQKKRKNIRLPRLRNFCTKSQKGINLLHVLMHQLLDFLIQKTSRCNILRTLSINSHHNYLTVQSLSSISFRF